MRKHILDDIVKFHFQWIDEELAFDEMPVGKRILPAAIKFVREAVTDANIDTEEWKPDDTSDLVRQPWFRIFYSYAEQWYEERYGVRLRRTDVSHFRSAVLVAGTPFAFRVPLTCCTPKVEGESATLSWPDKVKRDENLLEWIIDAPDFQTYSPETIDSVTKDCFCIANRVREIFCRLTGAELTDHRTRAVLAGVKIHLQSAATLILREDEDGRLPRVQWELQMACESAFKGLLQQRTGTFREIHDLFELLKDAEPFVGKVASEWLCELPRWYEAANLRYGLGDEVPTLIEILHWYEISLKIIAGVLTGLKGLELKKVSITFAMPPWLRDYENPKE